MLNFTYHNPTKILFGKNQLVNLSYEIKKYSDRVLLAYGGGTVKKTGLYDRIISNLKKESIFFTELSGIQPNPRITSVREGIRLCRDNKIGFILAAGGGSIIDCCKAISAGVNYDGDPWDFLTKHPPVKNPLPIGTILTLAATGSENNGYAVISNDETEDKLSMGTDSLRPKFSICDPELTFTVNRWHTAAGAADIMSHIFEQYFNIVEGADVPDRIMEAILKVAIKYAPIAVEQPDNYEARANLMWASSLSLCGLTASGKGGGDWAAHAIEHELSAVFDVTHGIGLAILFPNWMKYCLSDETLSRFISYANNVWNISTTEKYETANLAIEKTREFFNSIGIPSTLKEITVKEDRLEEMAAKAVRYGPIGKFKLLNKEDVLKIYRMSY